MARRRPVPSTLLESVVESFVTNEPNGGDDHMLLLHISKWNRLSTLAATTTSYRSRWKMCLGSILALTMMWMLHHPHSYPLNSHRNQEEMSTTRPKTILYLNQYWDFPHFQFGEGSQPFVDAGCPVSDCVAVQDTTELSHKERSTFDAILVHGAELTGQQQRQLAKSTAEWRRPHQRFIYMTMESPLSSSSSYYQPRKPTDDLLFNWTMTYRRDSDLPRPYGFFQPHGQEKHSHHNHYYPVQWEPPVFLPYDQVLFLQRILSTKSQTFHRLAERPKKVAWIVSRCDSPSRREAYVAKLSDYIQVDIMGACGVIPCNQSFHQTNRKYEKSSKDNNNGYSYPDNCTIAVEHDYKFYLAFENSFCQDYVTEKFFRHLQGSSPPLVVVLGGANYSSLAPPQSYINALDYESPQALAAYLHHLDQNNSLYLSYFWWQDYYQVHSGTATDHASTMCRLCEMLHDNATSSDAAGATKVAYPSISTWHGSDSQCWKDLPKVIRGLPRNHEEVEDDKLLADDHF